MRAFDQDRTTQEEWEMEMQEAGIWARSRAPAKEVYKTANLDDTDRRMHPGWWLLPSAVLGSMSWVGILYLVFW